MAGSTRARDSRRSSSSVSYAASSMGSDPSGARDLARSTDGQRVSADARKPRWQARLTLGQVAVMWSVIAGTMVMVFLFGLYAGREQGLRRAFEEYGGEAVRLAVANPIPQQPVPAPNALAANPAAELNSTDSKVAAGSEERVGLARNEPGKADLGRAGSSAPSGTDARAALAAPKGSTVGGLNATGEVASGGADRGQTAQILALETTTKPGSGKPSAQPEINFAPPTSGLPTVADSATGNGKPTIQLFKDDAELNVQDRAIGETPARAAVDEKREIARVADSLKSDSTKPNSASASGTIGALAKGGLVIDRMRDEKPTAAAIERAAERKLESERAMSADQGKGRWYVQVAAARTRAEANAMNKKLAQAKLKGKIEEAKVGRNTYYRVVVGPYSSKDAANAARGGVKRAKAAAGDPFVRQAQ